MEIDPQYKDALCNLVRGLVISIERPLGHVDLQTIRFWRLQYTESEQMVKGSDGGEVDLILNLSWVWWEIATLQKNSLRESRETVLLIYVPESQILLLPIISLTLL